MPQLAATCVLNNNKNVCRKPSMSGDLACPALTCVVSPWKRKVFHNYLYYSLRSQGLIMHLESEKLSCTILRWTVTLSIQGAELAPYLDRPCPRRSVLLKIARTSINYHTRWGYWPMTCENYYDIGFNLMHAKLIMPPCIEQSLLHESWLKIVLLVEPSSASWTVESPRYTYLR